MHTDTSGQTSYKTLPGRRKKKTLFCSLGKLPMEKIKVPIVLLTKMFINLDILLVGTMMKEFSLLGIMSFLQKKNHKFFWNEFSFNLPKFANL